MKEELLALSASKNIIIEYSAAEKLIREGSGDAALLYICLLKNGGVLSVSSAAAMLKRSESEIKAAFSKLERMGLRADASSGEMRTKEELPEYTAEDIRREIESGSDFSPLRKEVENVLGRIMNTAESSMFLGLYRHLGLPAEVILLLVSYCVEECREKYGPGRMPTARWIEKEGYVWAREELFTLELAEAYLKRRAEARSQAAEVKRMFGIEGRRLSVTESRYIAEWTGMGFDSEVIELAFDRTVTKTGKLAWPYMNSILKSWHSKGLHKMQEILEKDGESKPLKPEKTDRTGDDDSDMEQMKEYLRSLRDKV